MNTLLNLKNNLIQNFYILGFPPSKFFQISDDNVGFFLNIFKDSSIKLKPEVISKFPPENGNFNSINDDIVLAHCFPQEFKIIKCDEDQKQFTQFEFSLDNILFNYNEEDKKLYSKIYFTCLEFYESLEAYNNFRKEIINTLTINKNETNITYDKNNASKLPFGSNPAYLKQFIPKIICFASLLPFTKELTNILIAIYHTYAVKFCDNSILPIEKFIEQIVLNIPIPLTINKQIDVIFKFGASVGGNSNSKFGERKTISSTQLLNSFSNKENPNIYNKVHFPLFNIDEAYRKYYNDNSIAESFSFLTEDDIIKIFKNIILEVPILVFCNDRQILTGFIENFLGLLSPFNYILPTVSILPNKFFGIINAEPKFFFGINQNYNSNFFEENNIDIDKNMIVVNIDTINKSECRVEEIKKSDEEINYLVISSNNFNQSSNLIKTKNNNDFVTNDYIMYNGSRTDLIDIILPQTAKKKLLNKLASCIIGFKKKSKKASNDDEINYKIQYNFFKFFVNIMSGYTDYFLNSKFFSAALKTKNCGDNIRYKSNNNQSDINFLIENFNLDEFLKQTTRDIQPFYYAFFNTKMFLNFLREKIYFNNKQNSLAFTQFDQLIYLKKHEDMRKAKENKGFFEDFKEGKINKPKAEKSYEITLKNNTYFTLNELLQITVSKNKMCELLVKYAQLVQYSEEKDKEKLNNIKIKYCLFPKLIYNDSFFENNYETLFFSHNIELPSNKNLEEYKKMCKVKEDTYINSRKYAFIPSIISKLQITNNSKANFEIFAISYIEFNWFILLCCSLEYCEPIEREIRLNKVFELLDKLDYIEEQVLILLYMTFIKYGNKTQCIKIREKLQKFIGHSNYLFLSLLCLKLNADEKVEENNDSMPNQKKKYFLKQRSIILSYDNFFISRTKTDNNEIAAIEPNQNTNTPNTPSNISHKETIIFSTDQFCEKCKNYNKFSLYEVMDGTINETKINYNYKCSQCQAPIKDIIIKYQILLFNKNKNETFIAKVGEFKLLSAYRLYSELKYYLITRKDYSLNIDNIFTEKQIDLFNFIFYFSQKNLPFDFLIPYKKSDNFENVENNLGNMVNEINNKRIRELKEITQENVNKKLIETYKGEFVPINISDGYVIKKFENVQPCLNVETQEGENQGKENEIGNCICINGKVE